jgi:hypothetical protein
MRPPKLLDKPNPFTPDLLGTCSLVLDFLQETQKLPAFDSPASVQTHLQRYLCFLILQEEYYTEELVPSVPIQSVWFSHMLQSCHYKGFIQENFPNIWKLNHPVTRELDPAIKKGVEDRTEKLMAERYPPGCDLNSLPKFGEIWEKLKSGFTPEMVIDDRDWIKEFNKFTEGTDVKSIEFRKKVLFGYRRLIYLKYKFSQKVEEIGFSPCPSIDLIWHTHLLHPQTYETDLLAVLGHVPMHKLLDVKDRTEAFMDSRDDQSMELWNEQYEESIFVYAVV